jgi:formiminoglutamase
MSAWPNLSELLLGRQAEAPVALVGAPLNAGSVTPGRCDLAPESLRSALRRIGRYDIDTRREIATQIADYGDAPVAQLPIAEAIGPIQQMVAAALGAARLVLLAGGNNAVTRPGVLALGHDVGLEQVGLITLDAHLDMRDTAEGLSNGNPVRALLEDGLPGRNIAQIGLAPFANSKAMHGDAAAAGNLLITMSEVRRSGIDAAVDRALEQVAGCTTVAVDCDIDVIDRGQLPGAPGARPGGMAAQDFFRAVRRLASEPRVRLIDLTEWDPPLDPSDLTALTAGRWLAECLAGFEERPD